MDRETKQRVVGAAVLMVLATILIPLMFGSPQDPRATIQPSFTAPLAAEVPASPTPVLVAQKTPAATPLPEPSAPIATPEVPVTAPPLPTPKATPKPTATPTAVPTATPTAKPTATPTARPTARPRATAAPTPPLSEPPPRAKPLTPPAESSAADGHRWTVQVASYKYEDPAKRLRTALTDAGYDSFIVSKVINGTRYYRVRVYVVGSEAQVMAAQGRIEKRFKVKTRRYY